MYVKYTYLPTQTQSGFLNDLVKIITTNSVDNLSPGANTGVNFTSIISGTTPGNWTLHDAAPANGVGTYPTGTSVCLKSMNTDGVSAKYMQLGYTGGVTQTSPQLLGWENWNNTDSAVVIAPSTTAIPAHTGLNPTTSGSVLTLAIFNSAYNMSVSSTVWLLFTPQYAFIVSDSAMGGYSAGMTEFSRDTPTTAGGIPTAYPCHAVWSLHTDMTSANPVPLLIGISRFKNPTASGDLADIATHSSANPASNINSYSFGNVSKPLPWSTNPPTQPANSLGAGEVPFTLTMPIVIGGAAGSYSATLVILGQVLGGILMLHPTYPTCTHLDEMVVNNVTYVVLKPQYSGGWPSIVLIPKV